PKSNGTSKTNGHDADDPESNSERVVRIATSDDEQLVSELRSAAQQEFAAWAQRISQWKLALELIDLEWTLDRTKLILYVLSGRGPDCTKLALQAAAAR